MTSPSAISLYTGAGGLDYGLEAAGFEVLAANDSDHDSCQTIRENRRWPVVERDIFETPTAELLGSAGKRVGEVDLLVGGPPCQPFSKSGYWVRGDTRRLSDPRADTLAAYLRVVEDALPRAFFLENVDALAYAGKSEGITFFRNEVNALNSRTNANYKLHVGILNAADFGVPQVRRRLFIVASRDGEHFEFPTNLSRIDRHERLRRANDGTTFYRNAWDALADVDSDSSWEDLALRGKWADLLPSIPEGQNYLWHTSRGGGHPLFGWRRRYWGFLLKLSKERPSWTLQAQPGPAIGPFHWDNRRLSTRELCRLQTFPDDVHIVGSRTSVQRQVGNAVPSLLAEVLGREIRRQLFSHAGVSMKPRLLPDLRVPIPSAEPYEQDPPQEFLSQSGWHAPHPGTGKGAGAQRRLFADSLARTG